jgi:hypothetical protein
MSIALHSNALVPRATLAPRANIRSECRPDLDPFEAVKWTLSDD